MNNIIGVDADGVILNFLHQWEVAAKSALRRTISMQSGAYDLSERYQLTEKECTKVWNKFHNDNHWRMIPEIPGAAEAIKKLIGFGYEPHVITAIPQHLLFDRIFNFHKIGMPQLKVHCVSHNKQPKLEELSPFVYFDDNPAHIEEAYNVNIPHRVIIPAPGHQHTSHFATHVAINLANAVNHLIDTNVLMDLKRAPLLKRNAKL
ncbi:MAG: hypothetical protein CTY35_00305 [Methylotenera sp.]|uniref:hypothetical protein n=1 Tax=Methylotenera sp. TaxID=2051956 RepID=UPI000D4B078A|nr:hypothetical protein [Methylotenera sp.]PPC84796.1 MAG: hypothetical protein CTY38_00300 [Methylotenera sp.]PPD02156.1 MAG: hypothetical protein CTY35_00305 [Methylotenera sp.]